MMEVTMKKKALLVLLLLAALLLCGCGKTGKLSDLVEAQKDWYCMDGYMAFSFENGVCTITSYGTGGDTYQTGYRVVKNKHNGNYLLWLTDGSSDYLYRYTFMLDEETGAINYLQAESFYESEQIVLNLHPGKAEATHTFLEENEEIIVQSVAESEESLSGSNPQSPGKRYSRNTRDLEDQIRYTNSFLTSITGEKQPELLLRTPEPVMDTLYLSPDRYAFEPLDYEPVDHGKMNFASEDEFLNYLTSISWFWHRTDLDTSAHKFNGGYVDINYKDTISSVWIDFGGDTMVFSLGNIITNELRDSSKYRYSVEPFGDSYVCLVQTGSFSYTGQTEYLGETYDIDFMFFVDESGLLNQALVLYRDGECIPFSSNNVFADCDTILYGSFDPMQFDPSDDFHALLKETKWVLSDGDIFYDVDVYVKDLVVPAPPAELEFDDDFITAYEVGNNALFQPLDDVIVNHVPYKSGLYFMIDSEGRLSMRLALYSADQNGYKFTAHGWLYHSDEQED